MPGLHPDQMTLRMLIVQTLVHSPVEPAVPGLSGALPLVRDVVAVGPALTTQPVVPKQSHCVVRILFNQTGHRPLNVSNSVLHRYKFVRGFPDHGGPDGVRLPIFLEVEKSQMSGEAAFCGVWGHGVVLERIVLAGVARLHLVVRKCVD